MPSPAGRLVARQPGPGVGTEGDPRVAEPHQGTFLLNVLGEGLVLTIFRAGEYLSKTHVDKEIFRRCMQDEARHVSYGTLELKNFLDSSTDREKALSDMHRFADLGEQIILTALSSPGLLEPLAVLMGGGVDKIDEGMEGVSFLWGRLLRSTCSAVSGPGLTVARR